MKSYPNELEPYTYEYSRRQQHYNPQNDCAPNEHECRLKGGVCDQCNVISTQVGSGSSLFHLLPILLVSGIVGLAIILLVSASVLYIQCKFYPLLLSQVLQKKTNRMSR